MIIMLRTEAGLPIVKPIKMVKRPMQYKIEPE